MNFELSKNYPGWTIEREIANEIIAQIRKKGLDYKLDDLTRGRGDCFPIAILQQCRRNEIKKDISPLIQFAAEKLDYMILRKEIRKFVYDNENNEKIMDMKEQWNEGAGLSLGKSWDEFWNSMIKPGIWVDQPFIQATAWYFRKNIEIINSSSQRTRTIIDGEFENIITHPCILVGFKPESHYQSILPHSNELDKEVRSKSPSSSHILNKKTLQKKNKKKLKEKWILKKPEKYRKHKRSPSPPPTYGFGDGEWKDKESV